MQGNQSIIVVGSVIAVRESRIATFGALLFLIGLGVVGLAGCYRAPQPALAPQLLFDTDEIAAYVDEFPVGDYQIAKVPNLGRFYVDDNPAQVKKTLLRGKPWEPYMIRELRKFLEPGDTALDIGAHIGSLAIPMAHIVGPTGTVYAFEPQKKIYRELALNVKLNEITNIVPLRFALSSETAIIEMDPVTTHDGRVQIGRGGDRVEARTIDSFGFPQVALIKIDVEGHELGVLRGAQKTIATHHPVILAEIRQENYEVIASILKHHGYSFRRVSYHDYVATYEPKDEPGSKP